MDHLVKILADYSVAGLEILGIAVICLVALAATLVTIAKLVARDRLEKTYHDYRHSLIRGTLIGLEILVAADIIRTVTVQFDIESIGTLSLLVLVRTFLSFTLEVELSGKWPWQSEQHRAPTEASSAAEQADSDPS